MVFFLIRFDHNIEADDQTGHNFDADDRKRYNIDADDRTCHDYDADNPAGHKDNNARLFCHRSKLESELDYNLDYHQVTGYRRYSDINWEVDFHDIHTTNNSDGHDRTDNFDTTNNNRGNHDRSNNKGDYHLDATNNSDGHN